ncbi:arabinosyltransferase domain-containing protein [Streptomyces himalayensis]|nr:arabinosyltransferase domain-containing protein [Streptomyces himalayensis]
MSAVARPYTWFETSPTPAKSVLAATSAGCIVVTLALAFRQRRTGPTAAVSTRRRTFLDRRTALDASVAAVLAIWLFVGPATVDDGFAMMTVRNYAATGDIGNYYRWFNASEAPFTLVQQLMRVPAGFGLSMPLLRLPSVVVGLATWLLLHRAVLPLLIPQSQRFRGRIGLLAVLFFLACWLPYNMGVRPEPYVALGTLATFACLLRGTDPGAARPLAWLTTATLSAGLTLTVTPAGVAALLILGAFTLRCWPIIHAGTGNRLVTATRCVSLLCAGSAGGVATFADNSLHGVRTATRLHDIIGPSLSWYQEPRRYASLFSTTYAGTATKRVAVLLVLTALAVAVVCALRADHVTRRTPGLVPLLLSTASLFAAMCLAPSKWTHHFGSLAGLGPALLLAVVVLLVRLAHCGHVRAEDRWIGLCTAAAVALAAGLSFAGPNQWLVFNHAGLHWTDTPVRPAGLALDSPLLWLAAMGCIGLLAAAARRHGRARPAFSLLPAAGLSGMALVSTVLLIGSFTLAPFTSPSAFTLARFSYSSVTESGCGLLDAVEALPVARGGILRRSDGHDVRSLPRAEGIGPAPQFPEPYLWVSAPPGHQAGVSETSSYTSPWFTVPRLGRDQTVTVWVAGRPEQGNTLSLQFADEEVIVGTRVLRDPEPDVRPYADPRHGRPRGWRKFREWRLLTVPAAAVPSDARRVRIRAVDATTDPQGWLAVSAPSIRDTVPLRVFLRDIHPLYVDWHFAFLTPCRSDYPRVGDGTAQSMAASIEEFPSGMAHHSAPGGVFHGVSQLSTRTEVPTRAIGSPGLIWGHLYLHSYGIQQDAYDVTTWRVPQSGITGQGPYFFDK